MGTLRAMSTLNQSTSQESDPMLAATTGDEQPNVPLLLEETAGTRSSLQDVLSAWIFFVLMLAAFAVAALVFDIGG